MARRVSFLAIAAGQSSLHGRPFLRIGMIAAAFLSMMAMWQRRVSQAPLAVTVPIASPLETWLRSSGQTGLNTITAGGEGPTIRRLYWREAIHRNHSNPAGAPVPFRSPGRLKTCVNRLILWQYQKSLHINSIT